jgi:hypothetical protein
VPYPDFLLRVTAESSGLQIEFAAALENDKTMTFSESRYPYTSIGKRWAIFEHLHQLFTESTDGCLSTAEVRGSQARNR